MSWTNAVLITLLVSGLAIATIRSVARRRMLILVLVDLPLAILFIRWAIYRAAWLDLAVGGAGAGLLLSLWWLAVGRRLGPPRDDNILVLTQDDPPPP